jgi:4-diphosphocytidyl-2-C-methyl-D-erythritol kinase
MKRVIIKSCCKINLGLRVVNKRLDGFHDIETIFYPLRLCDVITFIKDEPFSFTTQNTLLQEELESNLIVKSVRVLEKLSGKKLNVAINLEKNIPIGAGLGGGSSNAASTLLSLNELFLLNIPKTELVKAALQLGSDVPFFFKITPAYATGRGEKLTHIDFELGKHILLINPGIHVSTKWAYESLAQNFSNTYVWKEVAGNPNRIHDLLPVLVNDFEKSVFEKHPEIGDIKSTLLRFGASFALMSGSGSSVFGLFDDYEQAHYAQEHYRGKYFTYLEEFEKDEQETI